jgi:hypothetical protein
MGVYLTGVHLIGIHLIGVYPTGVHLMGVYLTGVHLMGVYLMGVPRRRVLYGRVYVSKSKKAFGETFRSSILQTVVDLLRSELLKYEFWR